MSNENKHPKSYNNPNDWAKIDGIDKNDFEKQIDSFVDQLPTESDIEEIETVEAEEYKHNPDFVKDEINEYNEIFALSAPFESGNVTNIQNNFNGGGLVAKFEQIEVEKTYKAAQKTAKDIVTRVIGFVKKFDDAADPDQEKYLESLAKVAIDDITDLEFLAKTSIQLIKNTIEKINVSMGDDVANTTAFSKAVTEHIKIRKELKNAINSLAINFKRQRTEVLTSAELGSDSTPPGIITENYGVTQFNNGKDLLKMLDDYEDNK